MKAKIVSYTLDTLPELTDEEVAQLRTLAGRPDSEIDTSDIPELTDEQWKHAVRGRFGHPRKPQTAVAPSHSSSSGSGEQEKPSRPAQ